MPPTQWLLKVILTSICGISLKAFSRCMLRVCYAASLLREGETAEDSGHCFRDDDSFNDRAERSWICNRFLATIKVPSTVLLG